MIIYSDHLTLYPYLSNEQTENLTTKVWHIIIFLAERFNNAFVKYLMWKMSARWCWIHVLGSLQLNLFQHMAELGEGWTACGISVPARQHYLHGVHCEICYLKKAVSSFGLTTTPTTSSKTTTPTTSSTTTTTTTYNNNWSYSGTWARVIKNFIKFLYKEKTKKLEFFTQFVFGFVSTSERNGF